jgi:maltose O-acetyltransferase
MRARSTLAYRVVAPIIACFPAFVGSRLMAAGLRAAGVRLGRGSLFWGAPRLSGSGDFACRLTVGECSGFNVGCELELEAPIVIGDRVAVGHDVRFVTRDPSTGTVAPIEVGNGAWLGARCVIMPGVTIGAGSVVSAGVVVMQSIGPDLMVTGNRKISLAKWRAKPASSSSP